MILLCYSTVKGEFMEKKKSNISFNKSRNSFSPKLNLPLSWLEKLEINQENKEVEMILDEENKMIIVKKI